MHIFSILLSYIVTLTICVVVLSFIALAIFYKMARIKEQIYQHAEHEIRIEIGFDLVNCANWVRYNDDAVLIVQAIGNLLATGYDMRGGALKNEYNKLKSRGDY